MDKKGWVNEHYGHNISDGDSVQGSVQCGCYRNETTGTLPSSGRCCLNVTREGDSILYNCLSVGCELGGGVLGGGRPTGKVLLQGKPRKPPSNISDYGRILPAEAVGWLQQYDIDVHEANVKGIRHDELRKRLVFNVSDGVDTYGIISRDYLGGAKIKWWKDVSAGGISAHQGVGSRGLIVESAISAMRINILTGLPTLALLGTAMPESKIVNIQKFVRRHGITEAQLWLDPDVPREKRRNIQNILTSRVVQCKLLINKNKPHSVTKEEILCLKNTTF